MSKTHDTFIQKYKELEDLLNNQKDYAMGTGLVRDYETVLAEDDPEKAEKLKLCRWLRNYISHHSDYEKMIAITPAMQAFLDDIVNELHLKSGTVKDHMTTIAKYGKLTVNDTIFDAALLMHKKNRENLAVFDKNDKYVGHITTTIISNLVGLGKITMSTKINKYLDKLIEYPHLELNPNITMDYINENNLTGFIIVVKGSKVVGIFER